MLFLTVVALLALLAVVGTIVTMARDGYHAVPERSATERWYRTAHVGWRDGI
jgi:hypothetical protein